ncbi:hypothetical protein EVAR_101341_1 [Eumeta japonica]|uniref:Uncharacterized protein n=1 Tax=Eumeta variegata TaxID=151549 RepID=A0A4C1SSV5_EUMVA|nr:hypothetical protein EVAR_101341_1 [Eumeta japonica]
MLRDEWQELYRYFPDVSARLSFDWVELDYQTSQLLTGHGCELQTVGRVRACMARIAWRPEVKKEASRAKNRSLTRRKNCSAAKSVSVAFKPKQGEL